MTAKEKRSALAQEVLRIAQGKLLVQMRFLDRALYELKPEENEELRLSTDGEKLYYRAYDLLMGYRQNQNYAIRVCMHMLLHCVFRHMIVNSLVDHALWNLACDMAVEAVMEDLNMPMLEDGDVLKRKEILETLRDIKPFTAEKVYRWLMDHPGRHEEWEKLFEVDEHDLWYRTSSQSEGDEEGSKGLLGIDGRARTQTEQLWKEISERMQMDMETFSKKRGDSAGTFVQSLRALNREKCDYKEFLRRFATRCEVRKLSPDEFDYIFYTYGLALYKDMPLIEPLEYREDKRIRDFVIAIDTSGSVAGKLVQAFLQKTFTILKQEETFDRQFNLHIIQCDAEIQEDAVIRTQEEFDEYIGHMKLRGFGGTDFRPVFEYVEKLREEKTFRDLRGLVYFTDGYGEYPTEMTDYQTAFVFVDDEARDIVVPAWAIKVTLETDDIKAL